MRRVVDLLVVVVLDLHHLIQTALELELQEGAVITDRVGETPCVFLAGLQQGHRSSRTARPSDHLSSKAIRTGCARLTASDRRAASILAAWVEQKAVREIMVFLHL
jgi:hypothetical protein